MSEKRGSHEEEAGVRMAQRKGKRKKKKKKNKKKKKKNKKNKKNALLIESTLSQEERRHEECAKIQG